MGVAVGEAVGVSVGAGVSVGIAVAVSVAVMVGAGDAAVVGVAAGVAAGAPAEALPGLPLSVWATSRRVVAAPVAGRRAGAFKADARADTQCAVAAAPDHLIGWQKAIRRKESHVAGGVGKLE